MTPITTQVAAALEARLASITVANGHATDIGDSVWRGFYAHAIDARQQIPLVAVQPDTEEPNGQREGKAKLTVSLNLVVVVSAGATDQPADELRGALADLRRVLLHDPGSELEHLMVRDSLVLGSAEYGLAPDSRFALAALPVSLSCIEQYED